MIVAVALVVLGIVAFSIYCYFCLKKDQSQEEETIPEQEEFVEEKVVEAKKYWFYSPHEFRTRYARALYKDIIVDRLFIEEPFHSLFTRILLIHDEHNKTYIKCPKTESMLLSDEYDNVEVFKAYLLHEYVLKATNEIYEDVFCKFTDVKSLEVVLLASLLKLIGHYTDTNDDGIERTLSIARVILDKYEYVEDVILLLEVLADRYTPHAIAQMINYYYEDALKEIDTYACSSDQVSEKQSQVSFQKELPRKTLLSQDQYRVF
jgi:hypothetical protein